MEPTFAETIYQTPPEWGEATITDAEMMRQTITDLIDAGGTDWSGISADDCTEWSLVTNDGVLGVYKRVNVRTNEWQVFTVGGGYYTSVGQFFALDELAENYPALAQPLIERHQAAASLGRIGGSRTSERKAAAARQNGRRGGWPKGRLRKNA